MDCGGWDATSTLNSTRVRLGAFICLPAMAATVKLCKAQVSVNQGQGYKQVAAASAVSTGDQVMAAPGVVEKSSIPMAARLMSIQEPL